MEGEISDVSTVAAALAEARAHQETLQTRIQHLRSSQALRGSISLAPPAFYANARHPVPCNRCGKPEIAGMRLKCAKCAEFNLCERCAELSRHEHGELVKMPFEGEHYNIGCDNCGQLPLEGLRYNCAICGSFDLCHVCKMTVAHQHDAWNIFAPLNLTASASVHGGQNVCYFGSTVSVTVTVRNLSPMVIEYFSLLQEAGDLPFNYHQNFALRVSPGETSRFLLIATVSKPPGQYEATLRIYLPEFNETTRCVFSLAFEVRSKGIFKNVFSLFS